MEHSSIPQGYAPLLSIYETQKAIGLLNRLFEDRLSGALRLHRVSAPLFPTPGGTHRWSTPWPSGSGWPSTATSSPWVRASTPI